MLLDGIYFGLAMDAYHADPALGGSDLEDILINPVQWHARKRNAAWRELHPELDKDTDASTFGTALHTTMLEPETFSARYFTTPDEPNLPKTKKDIARKLSAMGVTPPKMAERSGEFEKAARQFNVETVASWREKMAAARGDRQELSADWTRSLEFLRQVFERHPKAKSFLSHGRSEVSVFWTDPEGIRLKCRFDYLRTRTVTDVKSYALRDGDEPIQGFVSAAERYAYDFSAAHYMHMRLEAFPILAGVDAVFNGDGEAASKEDLDFALRVAAEKEPSWWWLACMTMGYPEVDCIEFPTSLLQFQSAAVQVDLAKAAYRVFRDKFGDRPDEAWAPDRELVRLTDYCFMSARARDRGATRWEKG